MIPDKPLDSLAPCLVGRDGKPLVRNGMIDSQALESYLSEEELLDEEDEADMSLLPHDVLLSLHVTVKHLIYESEMQAVTIAQLSLLPFLFSLWSIQKLWNS